MRETPYYVSAALLCRAAKIQCFLGHGMINEAGRLRRVRIVLSCAGGPFDGEIHYVDRDS